MNDKIKPVEMVELRLRISESYLNMLGKTFSIGKNNPGNLTCYMMHDLFNNRESFVIKFLPDGKKVYEEISIKFRLERDH